jgi:hypothetical protein
MLARAVSCAALLMLAACAAAMPGYTPPPFKEKAKHSTAMQSGDMVQGQYEMAEQERQMDCKRTRGSMMITIERLRHRGQEVPTSDVAVAASQIAPHTRQSSKGFDRDAEYARDRARLEAYNRHLVGKGCPAVDIEAELARAPEPRGKKY